MSRLALVLVLAAVGCDTFEPRTGGGPAFALDGVLDARTPRQEIRVQDIAGSTLDTPDRLPATVTSQNLGTGQTTVWRDSLVTLPDGVRAHVFVADLAVAAGEAHQIRAVRDTDGAESSVVVDLRPPSVTQGPPSVPLSAPAVILNDFDGRFDDASFRYVVRRTESSDLVSFSAPGGIPQESQGQVSFVASLFSAESRATRLLYGSAEGDPVFVDARLEGLAVSAGTAPVVGGVGRVGWAAPVSVSIPFQAETLALVGFVDGR